MKAIQLSLFKPAHQLDFYCDGGYIKAFGEDARLAAKHARLPLRYIDGTDVVEFSLLRQADIVLPRLVRAGFYIKMIER